MEDFNNKFKTDTLEGLSSNPKFLLSKYLYDAKGSKIFQDIMRMPEYYLTDCEIEIFNSQKEDIIDTLLLNGKHIELIELGAGDGLKTKILLSQLVQNKIDFQYLPIDISEKAVSKLVRSLQSKIPELKVKGLVGDYFQLIEHLKGKNRKIILFLGSNIGNFKQDQAEEFLAHLRRIMNMGDMIFIGFDLKKDPKIIIQAYNDSSGYTSAFNLNLLQRINDELDGKFNLDNFTHKEIYDEQKGTAKSFLKSKKKQSVAIASLNQKFSFEAHEEIFMERSQKYDLEMIESLAKNADFKIVKNYFDSRNYFVNSLWTVKK